YEIIYAQKDVIMSEVTKTVMSFALVGAFTYSAPYYAQYVIPFVMKSGQELSGAITGTSDVATNVDNLWDSLSTTLKEFLSTNLEQLGTFDFGDIALTYITWGIGYLGGAILIFYTTIFLALSTFMVGLLLSVGILFICFSPFQTTRSMFTSWCGSCLNYILLNVFYTISFGFVLGMIQSLTIKDPNAVTLTSVVTLLLIIAISVFLIEQIGTLCSTLTGGVGINGLTSAANGFGGKAASGIARGTGMRAFMGGFSGKMGNPVFKAGRSAAGKLQQMASRGSKVLGG
ncbi:type IV secretion system protein, partial [Citrobacter portucalensis]|uniref:type IV secretion system protein n=1 Tax=Citrobacter portucalensis TaxID=1639133 RepID=UPI00226B951F